MQTGGDRLDRTLKKGGAMSSSPVARPLLRREMAFRTSAINGEGSGATLTSVAACDATVTSSGHTVVRGKFRFS